MICVECGRPVVSTYKRYNLRAARNESAHSHSGQSQSQKGQSQSQSHQPHSQRADTIRLSRCEHCGGVADRYIERDSVLVFLDLVLAKPAVYRHLLFNRQRYTERGVAARYWKIAALYVFFEWYVSCECSFWLLPCGEES